MPTKVDDLTERFGPVRFPSRWISSYLETLMSWVSGTNVASRSTDYTGTMLVFCTDGASDVAARIETQARQLGLTDIAVSCQDTHLRLTAVGPRNALDALAEAVGADLNDGRISRIETLWVRP